MESTNLLGYYELIYRIAYINMTLTIAAEGGDVKC